MARKAKAKIDIGEVKLAGGKKSKANKPEQLDVESPMSDIDITVVDKNGKPQFELEGDTWVPVTEEKTLPTVDHLVAINQKIESLKSEKALFEQEIIDAAEAGKKDAANDDDRFVKTVNVKGTSMKIQIQFRDSYSAMDAAMETPLKQVFGDQYPIMFEKKIDASIREGKRESLKELLGDRYDEFIDEDTSIKPGKNFSQTFFNLRNTFKADQKDTIDKVKDACQSKPAVKYPK